MEFKNHHKQVFIDTQVDNRNCELLVSNSDKNIIEIKKLIIIIRDKS